MAEHALELATILPEDQLHDLFKTTDSVARQHLRVADVHGSKVLLLGKCGNCGKFYQLWVEGTEFISWSKGALIQVALPTVSISDREFLISGTCPTCWDKLFPADSEEE